MTQNSTPDQRFADLLHHRAHRLPKGDPVAPGIFSATTYHLPEVDGAAFKYARMSTPTWEEVEEQLAILEAAPCVVLPLRHGRHRRRPVCDAEERRPPDHPVRRLLRHPRPRL